MTETGHSYVPFVLLAEIVSKATAFTFCGKAYFLRNVRKASLRLLYCFFRGTLSPNRSPSPLSAMLTSPHTVGSHPHSPPAREITFPLTPERAPAALFYIFLKVNAVAVVKKRKVNSRILLFTLRPSYIYHFCIELTTNSSAISGGRGFPHI